MLSKVRRLVTEVQQLSHQMVVLQGVISKSMANLDLSIGFLQLQQICLPLLGTLFVLIFDPLNVLVYLQTTSPVCTRGFCTDAAWLYSHTHQARRWPEIEVIHIQKPR